MIYSCIFSWFYNKKFTIHIIENMYGFRLINQSKIYTKSYPQFILKYDMILDCIKLKKVRWMEERWQR